MKVIVCGGRKWVYSDIIRERLEKLPKDTTVIHGACVGADIIAAEIAYDLGLEVKEFPAQWDEYGNSAGPIRNVRMLAEEPDLVLAFHENIKNSKGTLNMVFLANIAGVPVELYGTEWKENEQVSFSIHK